MRSRGFTLIELVIVIAMVAILAVIALAYYRSATRTAATGDAASDVATRLNGLRVRAMRDGKPLVLVLLSPPANDPSSCNSHRPDQCAQACVLKNPQPAWAIDGFDPSAPVVNAEYDECTAYATGTQFALTAPLPSPPPPFDTLPAWDPALLANCATARRCVGFRFFPDGTAAPEFPGGPGNAVPKNGHAFVLGSDLGTAALQRGVVVSFPYGLVKKF